MRARLAFLVACLAIAAPGLDSSSCGQALKVKATLTGHQTDVRSLAFSPDGKMLASGGEAQKAKEDQLTGVIKLWDLNKRKERATLQEHTDNVLALVFTPDSRRLVSASADNTVKIWDLAKGKVIQTLKGHTNAVSALAIAKDGKTLASGSYDQTIKLWDLTTGKEIRSLTGHSDNVLTLAFSPDGKTLASGSMDKTVKLWNVAGGKELATLKGHDGWVLSLAFTRDGKTLASGSEDNTVKLWDPAKHKTLATLKTDTRQGAHVAFTGDGKTLVSGGPQLARDGVIQLWNVSTRKEKAAIRWEDGLLWKLALGHDDKTLATTFNNTIKLWALRPTK